MSALIPAMAASLAAAVYRDKDVIGLSSHGIGKLHGEVCSKQGGNSPNNKPETTRTSPTPSGDVPFDDGEEELSCLSTSSVGNTSVTVRDVSSNGFSDNTGSNQDGSLARAERTKAVFDKVVLDAMQRQHIRNKHKHQSKEIDSESDSSSGTADSAELQNLGSTTWSDSRHPPTHPPMPKRLRVSDSGISSEQPENGWCHSRVSEHVQKQVRQEGVDVNTTRGHRSPKRTHHRLLPEKHHHHHQHHQRPPPADKHHHPRPPPADKHHHPRLAPADEYHYQRLPAAPDSSLTSTSSSGSDEEHQHKQRRFFRTFTALRECGLMEISLQTAALMEKNRKIQEAMTALKRETEATYRQMVSLCEGDPAFGSQTDTREAMQNLSHILNGEDRGATHPGSIPVEALDRTQPVVL